MELILSFLAFGVVALLAAVSPGPDFLVVSKNSVAYSRKIGMYTAVGVGLGVLVHVTYTIIGVGLIISQSILLFSIIKILGAFYLIWLGSQLILEKGHAIPADAYTESRSDKTGRQALWEGFLTNALNPKATIFFVSVFTQVVSPNLPKVVQAFFGIEAAVIVGLWFIILALTLTVPQIKFVIAKVQSRILKIMGVALISLGINVVFSHQ